MVAKVLKFSLPVVLLLLDIEIAKGQTSDSVRSIDLRPVFITETKPTFSTTGRNITAITNSEIKESGAQTLSDALSAIPGISQLTTGAISKPVIRGLYGNRIQINVDGLHLEDQQWEDEHGLGLSDAGVERVELIKGPASLLFGCDAMGGVINVVEEDYREPGEPKQNLNLKIFSNTYGTGLDYGLKKYSKNALILRGSVESHADYSDGSGNRVPNTRFAMYNVKAGYIIHHSRWKSDNRLLSSYSQFGFIADTSELSSPEEEPRLSRKFEDAHHSVFLTLLSSKNTIELSNSTKLNFTIGGQSNLRQEQERGKRVDLNLMLNTISMNGSIEKQLQHDWSLTNGIAGMFQINTNLGSRIIVPDARIMEGSVFSYVKKHFGSQKVNANFEAGLRYDRRQTTTLQTGSFNLPGSDMPPFSHGFNELSFSVGQSLILSNLLVKAYVGSGFRGGNLAELSANGLHEGTPEWYVGKPDLKAEHCINGDLSVSYRTRAFSVHTSVFSNRFYNYIYLQPTNEEYLGYRIFRFEQTDAVIKGFEAGAQVEKEKIFRINVDYSLLDAQRTDHSWLPFIPANQLMMKTRFYLPDMKKGWQNAYVYLGADFTEAQNHVDSNEDPTPAYWLFNAGAAVTFRTFRIMVTGRNITNRYYYNHLSRLKYYGIHDIGRNIVINFSYQF